MNLKETKVTLVSGEAHTLRTCKSFFERAGTREVIMLTDGDKAVDFFQAGNTPQLVIVDIELSGNAAFDIMRHLAGLPAGSPRPVVIPVVNSPSASDVETMAKLGAVVVLQKPVAEASIQLRLRELNGLQGESNANPVFVAQIQAMVSRGSYPEAQQLLEAEISRHPGVAKYHVLLLRVLSEIAQEEHADQLARALIPKAEHYPPLFVTMTTLQLKRRNYTEAITYLLRGLPLVPLCIEKSLIQAETLFLNGEFAEAEVKVRDAQKLFGKCEATKSALVRVLAAQNRTDEVRAILGEMDDPTEPYQSFLVRGVLLVNAGHQEEAIEMYKKALPMMLDPSKIAGVLHNIALGYFKLRQLEKSKEFALKCMAAYPKFDKAKGLLIKITTAEKSPESAVSCQPQPSFSLTEPQHQLLRTPLFVRRSGLPFNQITLEGMVEEKEAIAEEVSQLKGMKDGKPTIKYDSEALKRHRSVFRGTT